MIPSNVVVYAPTPDPKATPDNRVEAGPVDVLILTALEDELNAVLALGDGWSERKDSGGFPYHLRQFTREGRLPLVVAAAWLGKMGRTVTAIRGSAFLGELDPACVAMCGICAGVRGETALGDVIIADKLYSFDEGKLIAEPGKEPELHHEIKTHELHPLWSMNAASLKREIDLPALQKHRPPSKEAQGRWLLHAQYMHEAEGSPAPDAHAEQETACPDWTEILDAAVEKGLLVLKAGALSLTKVGREQVLNERMRFRKKLPRDPDLRVHVGTVGTGSAVQKDPGLFPRLRRVMRSTIGVEMEGAAIGELAQHFVKRGIVVKAVSDHGDLQKDDSFRAFACRASAEVLLAFLLKYVEPAPPPEKEPIESEDDESGVDGSRGDRRLLDDRRDGFLARVERVALLRDPGAIATRHRAAAPFAGVLEIPVLRDGALVDLRIIAAVEQEITEPLVDQYQAEVELRFRQQDPLLRSTLVHSGPPASVELAKAARRRGVVLTSFGEYQRLFDFGP